MGKLNKLILTILFFFTITITSFAQNSKNEDYTNTIKQADEYFQQADYINAKTSYQYASRLKPNEQYPKDRLTLTIEKLREKMAKMEEYTIVLTKADEFFRDGDYENAIVKYKAAGLLIPSEGYPKEKLKEIDDLANANRKKRALYDDAIYRAEKYIKYRKYEEAISEYEKAQALYPEEQMLTEQITELQLKISEVGETRAAYNDIVANADRLYLLKYFESAKSEYERAIEAMPEEEYPKSKLREIEKLLVKKIDYDRLINDADEFYMNKGLENAKKKYQEALTIYPSESYPKDMIDKINTSLLGELGEDEVYEKSIASADQFFKNADFVNALKEYENAGNIKSRETYPQQKIAEINKILTEEKNAELNYAMLVNKGDQYLEAQDYTNAKIEFEKAKALKPAEKYAVGKLAEIATALQQQEAVMDSYNQSISKADQFFQATQYEKAVEQYQNALVILPGDGYATKMLGEIENIWQEQNNNQTQYTQLIAEADKLFADNSYQDALEKYNEAYDLNTTADYPAEKIAEIDILIQKIRDNQNAYNKAIATADIFYGNNEYKSALTEYQKANAIKPTESYPKERMDEISGIVLSNVEKEDEYSATVAVADNLFGQLSYEEAKMEYLKASYMKPGEQYPKNKIQEIETIISDKEATQAKFNMHVAAADRMMQAEEYDKAKAKYQEALIIFPDESYPKDKIAEIGNVVVATELAVQDSYNALIVQGDGHFDAQDYDAAKVKYQGALKQKPNESYPKQRLEEIEYLSDKLEQKEDNYSQLIAAGDRLFSGREFQEAKTKYQAASDMLPQEEYPKEKLNEINLIFKADYQEKQKIYDKAIADADKFFAASDLGKSMDGYKMAKSVILDETYPNQMIEKILGILDANSVRKLVTSAVILEDGQQRKFTFSPMAYSDRSSSMLFIQSQNLGDSEFKLFISYGKGDAKNGGYSVAVPAGSDMKEYLIPLGNQRNWSSKDNDWISLTTQGGSVEVRKIEITKQD